MIHPMLSSRIASCSVPAFPRQSSQDKVPHASRFRLDSYRPRANSLTGAWRQLIAVAGSYLAAGSCKGEIKREHGSMVGLVW